MRFFEIVLSGAAMVAAVAAQAGIAINQYPSGGVKAGSTYVITYSPADQTPTEIILRRGPSGNLDTVGTLGTATGGSFSWTVDSSLPDSSDYAIEITRGAIINYSGQFGLTGGSGVKTSSVASASATPSRYPVASAASSASAAISSAKSSASSAAASASSALASLISSASTAVASASIMPSNSINGTISSPTLSRSASSATASKTGSSVPESTGAASALDSSPLALIFGAVAAIAYLH